MFYKVDTELNSHGDESMDDLPLACLHTHAGVSIRKGGGGGGGLVEHCPLQVEHEVVQDPTGELPEVLYDPCGYGLSRVWCFGL